jgi:methylglutaconyl-CoA hydratase
MPEPRLLVERDEAGVVVATIDREERRNALGRDDWLALRSLVRELADDSDVRGVILTGAGDRAFAAGADIGELVDRAPLVALDGLVQRALRELEDLPVPTIAALNGHALGGGWELALACDLRVASPTAELGLTEASLAIIPGAGGTQRLPRLIGKSRAKDLILTARKLGAAEAERIGLVNRVARGDGEGALRAAALELARAIAANGPVAVRAAKDAIDHGVELPQREGLAHEARCYERVLETRDRLEALAAFAEKRKPRYEGR